jgi:hypothetical protein
LGKRSQHIPFRDHILTQLMKSALTDKTYAAVLFVNIPETLYKGYTDVNLVERSLQTG